MGIPHPYAVSPQGHPDCPDLHLEAASDASQGPALLVESGSLSDLLLLQPTHPHLDAMAVQVL